MCRHRHTRQHKFGREGRPTTSVVGPASSACSAVGMGLTAAGTEPPQSPVSLRLRPISGTALETSIVFHEQRQRPRLQLSARSKPVGADVWTQRDMGEGGKQWSGLNVSAERKKTRCAECTRPIPEGRASLLCERCAPPSTLPAAKNGAKLAQATRKAASNADGRRMPILTFAPASPTKLALALDFAPASQPADGNAGKPAEATANATTALAASVTAKECANAMSPWRERVEDTLHLVGVGLAIALCVGIGCAAFALRLSSRVEQSNGGKGSCASLVFDCTSAVRVRARLTGSCSPAHARSCRRRCSPRPCSRPTGRARDRWCSPAALSRRRQVLQRPPRS